MNIQVVTLIRDEADIIGEYLRHIAGMFDGGILIDHQSTDGSAYVLEEWCRDRPGWTYGRLEAHYFRQAPVTNIALYRAFEHGADAVMCIDCDEFVAMPPADLRRAVDRLEAERQVGYLNWRHASPVDFTKPVRVDEPLVVGRVADHRKLLIPRWVWSEYGRTVGVNQGAHSLLGTAEVPLAQVGEIIHIPIRSREQLERKLRAAAVAYTPSPAPHVTAMMDLLDSRVIDTQLLSYLSLNYSDPLDLLPDSHALATQDGSLTPSPIQRDPAAIVAAPKPLPAQHTPPQTGALATTTARDGVLHLGSDVISVHKAARGSDPKGVSQAPKLIGDPPMADLPYTDTFFLAHLDASLRSALEILRRVLGVIEVNSLLDVGCGYGAWPRVAGDLGVGAVIGVDGHYVDPKALIFPASAFRARDLNCGPLALQPDDPASFDLVVCMEVAEHLPESSGVRLIRDLTGLGDAVLFSAAIPGQGGVDHVNEQWPEYWAALFADDGFDCFDIVRPAVWMLDGVEWWYRQNTLVFARKGTRAHAALGKHGRPGTPLPLVHPGKLTNAHEADAQRANEYEAIIANLNHRIHESSARADELAAELNVVFSSRSWRITAPLRGEFRRP